MTDRILIRRRAAITGALALATALGTVTGAQIAGAGAPTYLAITAGMVLAALTWHVLVPTVAGIGYHTTVVRCPEPGCRTSIRARLMAGEDLSTRLHDQVTNHALHSNSN